MSFDAGSIKGSVDLDTTSFKGAEEGGAHVREVLESIAEIATEIAGPAFAKFGQEMQSAFAGFSEGPVVGSLNLVGIAAGAIRETVVDVGDEFHTMGLEAQKAGVSVEFMDRMANVAGTANVSVQQLGLSFKILEQNAVAAGDGTDKKAAAAFEHMGISSTQLAELLKNPEELFKRVQTAIGNEADQANRLALAHDVLGRGGAALTPIFAMSTQQFDKLADTFDRLSGGMDSSTAEMGTSLALLEAYFAKAWEGIERAVAKPILKYLQDHLDQIEPKIEAVTGAIVGDLGVAWDYLAESGRALQPVFASIVEALESLWDAAKVAGRELLDGLTPVFIAAKPVVEELWHALLDLAQLVAGMLKKAFEDLKPVIETLKPVIGFFADVVVSTIKLLDEAIQKAEKLAGINVDNAAPKASAAERANSAIDEYEALNTSQAAALLTNAQRYALQSQVNLVNTHLYPLRGETEKRADEAENLVRLIKGYLEVDTKAPATVNGQAILNLNDEVRSMLQAAVTANQTNLNQQAGSSSENPSIGPTTRPATTRPTTQTVNVSVNYDDRESTAQLAAKLHPALRKIGSDLKSRYEGATQQALAQASMGGL